MKQNLTINRIGYNRTNFDRVFNYLRHKRLGQFFLNLGDSDTTLLLNNETPNLSTVSVPADVLPVLEVLSLVLKEPKTATKPFLSKQNNNEIAETISTTLAKIKTGLPMNKLNSGMLISLYDTEKKLSAAWAEISQRLLTSFNGDTSRAASALTFVKGLFTVTLYEAKLLTMDTTTEVALAIRDIPAYDYVPRKADLTYDHIYIELITKLYDFYATSANEQIKRIAESLNQALIEWRNSSNKSGASLHANEVFVYIDNLCKVMSDKLTEFTNEIGRISYSECKINQVLALIAFYMDEEARLESHVDNVILYNVNFNQIDAESMAIIKKYSKNPYIIGMIANELTEDEINNEIRDLLGDKTGPSGLINTICSTFDRIFTSPYSRFKLCNKEEAIARLNIKCFKNNNNQNKVVYISKDLLGSGATKIETYTWSNNISADAGYSRDPDAAIVYRTAVNEEEVGVLRCFDEINLAIANGMQTLLDQLLQELANTNPNFIYVITSGLSDLDIMNLSYYYSDQLFLDFRDIKVKTYSELMYNVKALKDESRIKAYFKASLPSSFIIENDLDTYDKEIKQYVNFLVTLDAYKLIGIKAEDKKATVHDFILHDNLTKDQVSFNLSNFLHYNRNRTKLVRGDEFKIKFNDTIYNTGEVSFECKLSDMINLTQYLTFETNLVTHDYNRYIEHKTKEIYFLINVMRAEQASLLLWDGKENKVVRHFVDYSNELNTLNSMRANAACCSLKLVPDDNSELILNLDTILNAITEYCQVYEDNIYVGQRPSLDLTQLNSFTYIPKYNSFYKQMYNIRDNRNTTINTIINQQTDYILVEEHRTIDLFIAMLKVVLGRNTAIRTIGDKIMTRIDMSSSKDIINNSENFRYHYYDAKTNRRVRAQQTDLLDTIAYHLVYGLCNDLDSFMFSTTNNRALKAFLGTVSNNFHLSLLTKDINFEHRYRIWSLADTDVFDQININYASRFAFVNEGDPELGLTGRFTKNLLDTLMQSAPRGQRRMRPVNTYHQGRAQADEVDKLNSIMELTPAVRDVFSIVFGNKE